MGLNSPQGFAVLLVYACLSAILLALLFFYFLMSEMFLLICLFVLFLEVSLCSLGLPGILYVDQASLELRSHCLYLLNAHQ